MLTYLLLSGPGVAGRDSRSIDENVRAQAPRVLLQHAEPTLWSDDECLLWTWESATEQFGGTHVRASGRDVLALAGSAWAATSWATAAAVAPDEAMRASAAALRHALTGSFSAVSITRGDGFVTTDDTGTGHVYLARGSDVWAVSNRAPMAAVGLHGRWEPDVRSQAWMPMLAMFAGSATSVKGVELLPPGSAVRLERGVMPVLERGTTPWEDGASSGVDGSQALDEAAEALTRRAAAIAATDVGTPVVQLSGGKDSRLVLAALRAAGCAADVTYRTVGLPGAADREVSTLLAETFGLDHEVHEPQRDTGPTLAGLDQLVRRHVFQTAGMFGAWDLKGTYVRSSEIKLTGLFGELMRANYKTPRPLTTRDEAIDHLLTGMAWDRQRLLRPEVRAGLDEELRAWAEAKLAQGWSPRDLLDVFYAEVRIPRWVGGAEETNSLSATANLLQLRECVVAGFAATAEARARDELHYRLIERLDPALLSVPLADVGWDPALAEPGSPTNPAAVPSAVQGSEAWQVRGWASHRRLIAAELLASDNVLHEILDPDRVAETVGRRRRPRRTAQVFAAWAGSIWVSGADEVFPWNGPSVAPVIAPSRLVAAVSFKNTKTPERSRRQTPAPPPAQGRVTRLRRALLARGPRSG